jgi:predicted metal-dependent hydrolase
MERDPRFAEGVEQFNRRDFYAAHDAWESLWLERFGEEKDFLQGLILSAVALHHYSRGNLKGARSRFRKALEKLEKYPHDFWGMNLKNFLRRMNGTMHRLLTEEVPPPLEVKSVPSIRLGG